MTDNVTQLRARREILDDLEIQDRINKRINHLNLTFTHVVNNGKNYVVRIGNNALNQPYLEFFTIREFKDLLSHESDVLTGYSKTMDEKTKPVAEVWLRSQKANLCTAGITFYPNDDRYYNGKLNSYFGLGTKPDNYTFADIGAYLLHLELIICNNDTTCYEYLLNWLAHMIQKPMEKPEVAIVLKAGQGTGKGTFVDPIGKIIGAHFVHLTEQSQVVGRFNSLLENKVLIFADEFFAGSKKHTDQLKGMITEKTAKIERKGVDSIMVPSFSRLIMASNHENIVSIEKDERRYLYLEVSEDRKQNHDYFEALRQVIDNPKFTGQLLQFLLERDISNFNPRRVPQTKALGEQKLDNLDPLERWFYSCLKNGQLTGGQWPARELSSTLTTNVEIWLETKHLEVWGDVSRKLGHLLKKLNFRKVKQRISGNPEWMWEIPPLNDVQNNFCQYLNTEIEF
jgi:putative DNA primase/helicase